MTKESSRTTPPMPNINTMIGIICVCQRTQVSPTKRYSVFCQCLVETSSIRYSDWFFDSCMVLDWQNHDHIYRSILACSWSPHQWLSPFDNNRKGINGQFEAEERNTSIFKDGLFTRRRRFVLRLVVFQVLPIR